MNGLLEFAVEAAARARAEICRRRRNAAQSQPGWLALGAARQPSPREAEVALLGALVRDSAGNEQCRRVSPASNGIGHQQAPETLPVESCAQATLDKRQVQPERVGRSTPAAGNRPPPCSIVKDTDHFVPRNKRACRPAGGFWTGVSQAGDRVLPS